jgi:hypothetical protein
MAFLEKPQSDPDREIVPAIAREYMPHIVPPGSGGLIDSDSDGDDDRATREPRALLPQDTDSSEEEEQEGEAAPEPEPVTANATLFTEACR